MADTKRKKASLVVILILLIGLVFASLTAVQVVSLSRMVKRSSRTDHIENYVMLTTSIRESLEHTIEGFTKQLNPYVLSDIMKPGIFNLAGGWIQQNPQIRAKEYEYIMFADAQGLSFNDNGTRTNIANSDFFQATLFKGAESYIDNPVVSEVSGKKVIHVARPVRDAKGNVFAMEFV